MATSIINEILLTKDYNVTFSGTVKAGTPLTYTISNINIAGYNLVGIYPILVTAEAALLLSVKMYGNTQIIATVMVPQGSTASRVDPEIKVRALYMKI